MKKKECAKNLTFDTPSCYCKDTTQKPKMQIQQEEL